MLYHPLAQETETLAMQTIIILCGTLQAIIFYSIFNYFLMGVLLLMNAKVIWALVNRQQLRSGFLEAAK